MSAVKMSELAYTEFVNYLKESNVESDTLRVFLSGQGWGGPVFNLALDEQKPEDIVEKINDITFIMNGDLLKEYDGVTIKCGEENGRGGFTIEPNKTPDGGGCSSCSSCG